MSQPTPAEQLQLAMEAARTDRNNPEVWVTLGKVLLAQTPPSPGRARECFTRALQLAPGHATAQQGMAVLAARLPAATPSPVAPLARSVVPPTPSPPVAPTEAPFAAPQPVAPSPVAPTETPFATPQPVAPPPVAPTETPFATPRPVAPTQQATAQPSLASPPTDTPLQRRLTLRERSEPPPEAPPPPVFAPLPVAPPTRSPAPSAPPRTAPPARTSGGSGGSVWVIRSVISFACVGVFALIGLNSVEMFLLTWAGSGLLGLLIIYWRTNYVGRMGRTFKRNVQQKNLSLLGCLLGSFYAISVTLPVYLFIFWFFASITLVLSALMGPINLLVAILGSRKFMLGRQYSGINLRAHLIDGRKGEPHRYHVEDCVRRCDSCEELAPLAPCPACGTTIYEPGLANDDGLGIFCTGCQRGFTDWACPSCGQTNQAEKTLRSWLITS
ncbi:MAG: hypothetical protein WCP31_00795 [Chloroflexales bacterium]